VWCEMPTSLRVGSSVESWDCSQKSGKLVMDVRTAAAGIFKTRQTEKTSYLL
jgi:hypothetical protein